MTLQAMTLKELLSVNHINPERAYIDFASATPIIRDKEFREKNEPFVEGYKIMLELTFYASDVYD